MSGNIRKKLPWILLGAGGTLLGLSVIMLAGPMWVYAGNADQFTASAMQILAVYFPYLIGFPAAVLAILLLAPVGAARRLALVLTAVGTAAWIQGTFLVHDFGQLDGQSWQIEAPIWRVAIELIVLLAAAIVIWRLASRSPAIVAALIGALATAAVAEPVIRLPYKPDREPAEVDAVFEFSPKKNILIVLLDGMQSEIFEEVVQENPDIRASLDGFTYFPDTAGVGYSTVLTIPAIHSGLEYQPGMRVKEYFERVRDSSFMNEMSGYGTVLVNPMYGVCPSGVDLCTTAPTVLISLSKAIGDEADKLLAMGVFRAAPLFLKEWVYNGGKWRRFVSSEDVRTVHFSVEGNAFMEEFGARAALSSQVPTAKFLHLFSTHLPVAVGENCTFIGDQKSTREGFKQQAKCALISFARMISSLKHHGVYDRTAIILLSDHGSGGWNSSRGIPTATVRSYLLAVANPTLAVKPMGASGSMKQDTSPMSLADIPAIVCTLTSDCHRPVVEKPRVRQYQHYAWDGLGWNANDPVAVTRYRISGPVFDGRNWTKVTEQPSIGGAEPPHALFRNEGIAR